MTIVKNRLPSGYHSWRTLAAVALIQPWFAWKCLAARPDVVHAMDLDTGLVGLLSSRMLRVPFVYQCLDPYSTALPARWPRLFVGAHRPPCRERRHLAGGFVSCNRPEEDAAALRSHAATGS